MVKGRKYLLLLKEVGYSLALFGCRWKVGVESSESDYQLSPGETGFSM